MRLSIVLLATIALGAEHTGVVRFGGLPVPGASITASRGTESRTVITDAQGRYIVPDIQDGSWTIRVEMPLFLPEIRELNTAAPVEWNLKPAPLGAVAASAAVKPQPAPARAEAPQAAADELAQKAADGFLINGSMNNAAASPFALLPAFGNHRRGGRSLYNGNFGVIANHSAFDARAFSLTGQDTPKPDYRRAEALFGFGGPLQIPGLLSRRNAPVFTLNYQWTRNAVATTRSVLVPTAEQRSAASPELRPLLALYPMPNFDGGSRFNYQAPLVNNTHGDDLQSRVNKQKRNHYFMSSLAWRSIRTDSTDIFGFLDTGRTTGLNTTLGWRYAFSARTFANFRAEFSRLSTDVTPYFANRRDVSAEAGIFGNSRDPRDWGPPNMLFANGIEPLLLQQFARNRNGTAGVTSDAFLSRASHNITFGGAVRKQQFNVLGQQDARGTFTFTDFPLSTPDTATIALGNADKYLRGHTIEGFINDDWRVNPGLTINAGLRWEYWSPVTEKYGRLVNITGGAPSSVVPSADRNNFAPRLAFSWRPLPASSMVIRGGYGIYYDTSVYQPIAMRMAQQAPLSKSIRVSNPPSAASAFEATAASSPIFAVDPEFRVGRSQNWQLSIQRDLPWGIQATASYNGGRGSQLQQQILPNTFPDYVTQPAGYTWLLSGGSSTRHAAQLQIRRRLRSGFTANAQYTWAKAIDNAGLGAAGTHIAQNWLDLDAERARSNFDRRHLLEAGMQYTLLKNWTLGAQLTAGTGLPLTPILFRPVAGTGVTGSLRPDYTGASLYHAPPGRFLNPTAIAVPVPGRWGNAGRNSIQGPSQFGLNASIGRTFRAAERISFDIRADATNVLNTVVYSGWHTVAGNPLFGLPSAVSPMRVVQAVFRTRF